MNAPLAVPRRPSVLAVALLLAGLTGGCAARRAAGDRPPILSSPIGPLLLRMCDARGGLDAYRRVESVRFTFEAELGPAAQWPDRLGPAGSSGEGRPPRIGPVRVSFRLDDRSRALLEGPDGEREVVLKGSAAANWEDYALRTARTFLFFPFELLEPGWDLYREAGRRDSPERIWAVPPLVADLPSAYIIRLDERTGAAESIACAGAHGVLAGGVARVDLSGFRRSSGLSIPTEIIHLAPGGGREPLYPWEAGGGGGPDAARMVLHARISDVVVTERPPEPSAPPSAPGAGR